MTGFATELRQVAIGFGVPAGCGAGFVSPIGAGPPAANWFFKRRGLAVGIVISGVSASPIVLVPFVIYLVSSVGRRAALLIVGGALTAVVASILFFSLRCQRRDIGSRPYGAGAGARAAAVTADDLRRTRLANATRTRPYWLSAIDYFIRGCTTPAMITTHFVPHALGDLRASEAHASPVVAALGTSDAVGTITAGWVSDRFGRPARLGLTYQIRGLPCVVPLSFGGTFVLLVWSVVFGMPDVASVPLVTRLSGDRFGRRSMGTLDASIFFVQQPCVAADSAFDGSSSSSLTRTSTRCSLRSRCSPSPAC